MRPNKLSNATKVLIAVFAVGFLFTDIAEARDRYGERHFTRRHHHERGDREVLSGINVDSRLDRRHHRNVHLAGLNANRRYFERRYGSYRRPGHRIVIREYPDQRVNYRQSAYGGGDFPSETLGGTYFGGLSAWTDPGNGTYFYSERGGYGYYSGNTDADYRVPRAKIIRVTPSTAGRACSWEAGVCVIRR
ncbi:hypothetical protein LJR255_001808 [Pararhizobium sp. LjRoot255]|uniref:hypothetical protein n=1 Tax=Pararhizobium sp. LjRoot255 TaxID=3342298 RepID=UPI003ECF5B5D